MKAREVESFDDDLERLVERMTALMHEANGVGLAATQVGVLRRLFVFVDEGEDRVLVNPAITKRSKDTEVDDEGCLSLRDVLVPSSVQRRDDRRVDAKGEPVRLELERPRPDRPARARPPRRRAHHRPHGRRVAARRRSRRSGRSPSSARVEPPIAVAATAAFGADVLERLAVDARDRASSPGRTRRPGAAASSPPSPAKDAAERLGIPVLEPERLEPGLDLGAPTWSCRRLRGDRPRDVLAERLWLNVHPSLLPRWRGAAPVERALMAGDTETGVTIIRLVKELDAGPDRRAGVVPGRAGRRRGSDLRAGRRGRGRAARRRPRGPDAGFREQDGEPTYAAKITPATAARSRPPAGELVDTCGRSRPTSARAPSSTAAP